MRSTFFGISNSSGELGQASSDFNVIAQRFNQADHTVYGSMLCQQCLTGNRNLLPTNLHGLEASVYRMRIL